MAFSAKKKALEQAQKYAQKGSYDKALKEYLKHLNVEPSDTNARLKLGDLYLKRGDRAASIEAYSQVATQFSKSGFDAKAVAIYKQILRIDASYLPARRQLGDHFQRMGLASDALREFQEAVRVCQERGLKRDAFDLLKRVATLDPTNVQNRLSLADLLVREKLGDEARDEFFSLLEEFESRSQHEDVARVAERLVEAFPEEERGIAALARARVSLGQIDAAAEALKEALPRFPESLDLLEALVEACRGTGDSEGEGRAYREIAELYKRRGDPDKAREILQLHVPMQSFGDMEDTDGAPSIVLSEEADALDLGAQELDLRGESFEEPDEIELVAEDELVDTSSKTPDELLAEARVSLEFDDRENAARLAKRVLELDPKSSEAKKILDATKRPEPKASAPAAAKPAPAKPAASKPAPAYDDSLPDIELVLEDEEDADDSFASIEPPTQVDLSAPKPSAGDRTSAESDEFEIEIDADPEPEQPKAAASGSQSSGGHSSFVAEGLEQADLFFQQGMLDEAEQACRQVLERAPHHPQALLRLGEISEQRGGDPSDVGTDVSLEDLGDTDIQEDVDPVPEEAPPPRAKKKRASAPPSEPEPIELDPEPELEAEVLEADDLVVVEDGAERLMEASDILDPADLEPDEPEPDFDLAAALDEDEAGGAIGTGFNEVFRAFKKGIREQVGDEEAETHYDLAIAYKEMGLLEDAVEQLQLVRRSETHMVEGLALMATCKLELGRPQEAAGHLAEALAASDEGEGCIVALRYEMGEALLAAGKRAEALDAFKKVAGLDTSFREVQDRITQLGGEES